MKRTYKIGGTVITLDCDAAFSESRETEPFLFEGDTPGKKLVFREDASIKLPEGEIVSNSGAVTVYKTDRGFERVYELPVMREIGAVSSREDGNCLCRYNPRYREYFSNSLNLLNGIGLENVLAEDGSYILHCSFSELNGKALLFSGSSGIGKSTRAAMWAQTAGTRLVNGDKAVLRKKNGTFYAAGLPVAGSSGVFLNEEYPVGQIVFLNKTPYNSIAKLDAKRAFLRLFRNTVIHPWDGTFVAGATAFLGELAAASAVYESECDLSPESVEVQRRRMGL